MADKYYQEYGPISRRRAAGTLSDEEPQPDSAPLPEIEPLPLERPTRRRVARRKRGGGLLGLLLLVLAGAGGFLALPYAANLFAGDRAMDGVSLQGRSIAGMSHAEISRADRAALRRIPACAGHDHVRRSQLDAHAAADRPEL